MAVRVGGDVATRDMITSITFVSGHGPDSAYLSPRWERIGHFWSWFAMRRGSPQDTDLHCVRHLSECSGVHQSNKLTL